MFEERSLFYHRRHKLSSEVYIDPRSTCTALDTDNRVKHRTGFLGTNRMPSKHDLTSTIKPLAFRVVKAKVATFNCSIRDRTPRRRQRLKHPASIYTAFQAVPQIDGTYINTLPKVFFFHKQ